MVLNLMVDWAQAGRVRSGRRSLEAVRKNRRVLCGDRKALCGSRLHSPPCPSTSLFLVPRYVKVKLLDSFSCGPCYPIESRQQLSANGVHLPVRSRGRLSQLCVIQQIILLPRQDPNDVDRKLQMENQVYELPGLR